MACEGGEGCGGSRSIGETGGWCATGLECASVRIFFNTNFANFVNLAKGSAFGQQCRVEEADEVDGSCELGTIGKSGKGASFGKCGKTGKCGKVGKCGKCLSDRKLTKESITKVVQCGGGESGTIGTTKVV